MTTVRSAGSPTSTTRSAGAGSLTTCPRRPSGPAKPYPPNRVVGALLQHEVGAAPGGGDVLDQVALVDVAPDVDREGGGLVVGQLRDVPEVGLRILEGGAA